MIYDTVKDITTVAGNTISIDLTYQTEDGEIIDLNSCNVSFSLYSLRTESFVFEDRKVHGSVILIESEESSSLYKQYLLKIRIDNNNYIENYNIGLSVKF